MKKNSFVLTTVLYGVALGALAHAQAPAAAPPVAPPAASAAAPTKIAVINFADAMGRTKEGQKGGAEINNKFGPKKQDFDRRQTEIEQLTDKLNKGRATMSDDAQRILAADIQKKSTDLKRFGEDSQNEMDTDEQKLSAEIQQKMYPILQQYAVQNGYAVVLNVGEQSPVLWAANATNITDVIVALYDQQHPADVPKATGPPAVPTAPAAKTPPVAPPVKK